MFKYLDLYSSGFIMYASMALFAILFLFMFYTTTNENIRIIRYVANVKRKTKARRAAYDTWFNFVIIGAFIVICIVMVSLGAIKRNDNKVINDATKLPHGYVEWLKLSFTNPVDLTISILFIITTVLSIALSITYKVYRTKHWRHNFNLENAAKEKQAIIDKQLEELRSFVLREHAVQPLMYSQTLIKTINTLYIPFVELKHFNTFKTMDELIDAFPDNLSNKIYDEIEVLPTMETNGEIDHNNKSYTTWHEEDCTDQMLHDYLSCFDIKKIIFNYEVEKIGTRKVAQKVGTGKMVSQKKWDDSYVTKEVMKTIYVDEEYTYTATETRDYRVNGSKMLLNNAQKAFENIHREINETTPIGFNLAALDPYEMFGFATSYEQFEDVTNKISTADNERMQLLQAKI